MMVDMSALSPHPTRAGRWTIEREGSTVGFAIKHLGVATVHGHFGAFEGTVAFDAGGALSAEGRVRVDAIATGDAKRDGILQGEELFGALEFPYISFHGTATRPLPRGRLGLDGEITIRDHAEPLELAVVVREVAGDPDVVELEATGATDRTRFGMPFDRGASSALLGKTVKLELSVRARRAGSR
jgi:polyisoprenoid-binding protein YceI